MRSVLYLGLLAILAAAPAAQSVHAITDDGDLVVLDPAGTWRAATDAETVMYWGPPPPVGLGVAYRTDFGPAWHVNDQVSGEGIEAGFQMGRQPLFAALSYEDMEMPLEIVQDIVLANAKGLGEVEFLAAEPRTVNGVDVRVVEFRVTPEAGPPYRFSTMVYSGLEGTIRLAFWTFDAMFESHRQTAADLYEGLHLLPRPSSATSS